MAKNSKKDKRSRITLRVPSSMYERISKVAKSLNLDNNGVVNFLLSRWLGQMELEVQAFHRLTGDDDLFELMEEFKRQHPKSSRKIFVKEFIKRMMGEESILDASWEPDAHVKLSERLPNLNTPKSITLPKSGPDPKDDDF